MNSYEPSTPRAALAATSVAMTVITVSALVVLPAKLEFVNADSYTLAAATAETLAHIEVAVGATCAHVSEAVGREERIHDGCATVATQESRDRRHLFGSHRRTDTSRARPDPVQYSAVRD
jgi:hypothetical protein